MGKILILANFDVGLYKFRKDLIQELLKENQVYISLPDGSFIKPLQDMGCIFLDTPVDRRGINPKTDLKLLKRYRRMLREIRPDQVITYTIKPNIYGGIACRLAKIPYAVNITGLGTAFQKEGMLRKIITVMYRFACKKAQTVFLKMRKIIIHYLPIRSSGKIRQSCCRVPESTWRNIPSHLILPEAKAIISCLSEE